MNYRRRAIAHVTRGGAATSPASQPAGGQAGTLAATVTKAKLAKALVHGLKLRVAVPGPGRLTAKAPRASGSAKVKKAGSATVVLRFSKAARRALRGKRSVKLTVAVHFAPSAGPALDGAVKLTLKR